jgi:hypothetical protein
MTAHHHPHFQVGQTIEDHPFKQGDGAMLEMFRNDLPNILYVGLGNITADEQAVLGQASAQLGMRMTNEGACLTVFSLGELTFEMQFNAAVIPEEYFQSPESGKLSFSMLAIDSVTNTLQAIREFTLSEELSRQFVEVMQIQRKMNDVDVINRVNEMLLNTLTTEELNEKIALEPLQSVVAAPTCGCGHNHNHGHSH